MSEAKKHLQHKIHATQAHPKWTFQGIQFFLGTWVASLSQLVGFEDPTNKKSCKNHWPTQNSGSSLPIYRATLIPYEIMSEHFLLRLFVFFSRPRQKTPSEKLPLVERMCRWWLIRTSIGKRTPKKCPRKSRAELVKSQWITRPLIAMYPSRELTSYSPIGMKLHLPKLPFEWGYLTLQTKKRTSMPLQKSMLRIFTWVLSGLKNGYFQGPKIAGSVSGQVPMDGYHGAPHRVTQGSVPPHPTLHVKSCNQRTFGPKRRDEAGPRGQKFQFFSAFC